MVSGVGLVPFIYPYVGEVELNEIFNPMPKCSTLLINHSPMALLNTLLTVGIGISTVSGFLEGWVGIAAQFFEAQC